MNRIILDNKKVLLIAPHFFGYEEDIKNELISRGAIVDYLPDRIYESAYMKAATKLVPGFIATIARNKYEEELNKFARTNYDVVLVINGQTLSREFILELKTSFPSAMYVLYMWDSFLNRSSSLVNLSLYDSAYTFDPQDAKKYAINFRPLFYGNRYKDIGSDSNNNIDVCFIGTAHTDRYSVVSKIRDQIPIGTKSYWHLYLQARWVYWYYKITKNSFSNAKISEFKFYGLSATEVSNVIACSRAILDIEHPGQRGLTIRTIEALGGNKKIFTTNALVQEYDFYNPDNIVIVDRKKPVVKQEYLQAPYTPVSDAIYEKYSISGWLDHVLCGV